MISTVSQPNRQVAVFHGRKTKYCLLQSSPCRPDDNNRLESSSKGSSCPAVAFLKIFDKKKFILFVTFIIYKQVINKKT